MITFKEFITENSAYKRADPNALHPLLDHDHKDHKWTKLMLGNMKPQHADSDTGFQSQANMCRDADRSTGHPAKAFSHHEKKFIELHRKVIDSLASDREMSDKDHEKYKQLRVAKDKDGNQVVRPTLTRGYHPALSNPVNHEGKFLVKK